MDQPSCLRANAGHRTHGSFTPIVRSHAACPSREASSVGLLKVRIRDEETKAGSQETQLAPLAHGSWEVESCKALGGGGGGGGV